MNKVLIGFLVMVFITLITYLAASFCYGGFDIINMSQDGKVAVVAIWSGCFIVVGFATFLCDVND